jgi:uncharacterized LabA/DUF88 family protein
MPLVPKTLRAYVFFDGQNLFGTAKAAFGYRYPNYDAVALAHHVCTAYRLRCDHISFYTGVHRPDVNKFWYDFWSHKLQVMTTRGVSVFSRPLAYSIETISLPDGSAGSARVAREKGIDVRMALDIVRYAREAAYDVAVIFSQDQDLSEAVDEVHRIRQDQDRWLKVYCAFPVPSSGRHRPWLHGASPIKVTKSEYDACIDPLDYRA